MLKSLVLSVTAQCPIRCRFCGVHAGPHRKERMSLLYMTRMIDEVRSFGVASLVVFTGGEPFLLGDDLSAAVAYAAKRGFMTRIVTNAYWAMSFERAAEVLSQLKEAGLTEINYSCDDFHQEHIPLERIRWASDAASRLGIPALLAVKGVRNSQITPDYLDAYFGRKLARFDRARENPPNDVLSWGITVPVGWDSEGWTDDDMAWPADQQAWQGCCEAVLDNVVITSSGKLTICCGIGSDEIPETIIGDTNETPLFDLLVTANNDLIVNWLALEGPYSIMRFIQEQAPAIAFRERYVNSCHLCHDIFARDETRAVLQGTAAQKGPALSLRRAWLEAHRTELARQSTGQPADRKGAGDDYRTNHPRHQG
jgi:hypothetical protein